MKTVSRIALTTFTAAVIAISAPGCSASGESPAAKKESPLMEYLGAVYGTNLSDSEQQQRSTDIQKKTEGIVAQCMKEQGFEYQPNIQTGFVSVATGDMWKPDDREWVAQYGYGMIKNPMSDQPTDQQTPYVDPNQAYIDSLSATEQTAYWAALYGASVTDDRTSDGGSVEYDWTAAGCQGKAQHESNANPMQDKQFASLNEAINSFYTDIMTNAGFTEINQKWSACMADAGQAGFAKQTDAQSAISDKLSKLYENMTGTGGLQPNDPEMKKLAEEEITVALADLDCRVKTGYTEAQQKVQFDLERQFIADHKSELEALKAAAEQAGR